MQKIFCSVYAQKQIRAFEREMRNTLDTRIFDIALEIMGDSDIDPESDHAWDSVEEVRNYLWNRVKAIAECPYAPF